MFMQIHRAEVEVHQCQCDHRNDCQQCVEVVRDGTDEQFQTVVAFYNTGYSCCPGRNGSDDADGRRCGVDDISQFRTGNIVCVCYRTHNATYCQAVEVVVYEYQNAQQECGQQSAFSCLDNGRSPFAVCGRTASFVHQCNQNTQYNQEDQDAGIAAVRYVCQQAAFCLVSYDNQKSFFNIKVCVEQRTGYDTDKQ